MTGRGAEVGGPGCQGLTLSGPTLHGSLVATEGCQPLPLDFSLSAVLGNINPSGFCVLFVRNEQGRYLRMLLLLLNVGHGWCWRTRPWTHHVHAWEDRVVRLWTRCSLPCALLGTYGLSLGRRRDGSIATAARPARGLLPLPTLAGRRHLTRTDPSL